MSELEQSAPDVSAESSPATESTEAPAVSQETAPKQEQYVPYERFKELVEQKNEFSKKFEELEKRHKDYQSRFEQQDKASKGPSKDEQLLARLKGIDPEFAEFMQSQSSKAAKVEALEQRLAEYDQRESARSQEAIRSQASSALEKLQGEHKVDKTIHEFYVARIKEMAQANPNLGLQDLPNVYKGLHDNMNKFLEAQKRTSLTEYSDTKKVDSKVPAQSKAPAPKTGTKTYSKDPDQARSEAKAEMVAALKRAREV